MIASQADDLNSMDDSQRYGETADVGEDEQERSPSYPDVQSPVLACVASPIGRVSSPVGRISSPIGRVTSPLLTGDQSPSMGGRPRINKEEVRRRLLGRRSVGSPSPEGGSSPFGNQIFIADQRKPCKGKSWEGTRQSLRQRLAHKHL